MLGTGDGLEPGSGARNMAVDHALLQSVQAGARPVLRLYLWDPPTLSFGRNQRAVDVYDPARAAGAGIAVVRRPTGGLAVLHDRELTYCVLAPLALLGGPRQAYGRINDALVRALQSLGVAAARAGSGRARAPDRDTIEPCFTEPAQGEVVVAGRKLVGSAQRCEAQALLQHGSILLAGTQQAVAALLCCRTAAAAGSDAGAQGPRAGRSPAGTGGGAITLAELLGAAPAVGAVAAAVQCGFENVFGIRLAPQPLTCEELGRTADLETMYAAAGWTWRR